MASVRGRRVAVISVVVASAVVGLGAYFLRERVVESWFVFRLGSEDVAERRAAAARLGELGAHRAVSRLAALLRADDGASREIVAALRAIAPSAPDAALGEIFRVCLEAVRRGRWKESDGADRDAASALRECDARGRAALEVLASGLADGDVDVVLLCRRALVDAWPRSRPWIAEILRDAPVAQLAEFLGSAHVRVVDSAALRLVWDGSGAIPLVPPGGATEIDFLAHVIAMPRFATVRAMLVDLAREHERPEVRALALAWALLPEDPAAEPLDLALLRERYDRERDPLVRRAVVRIAGHLGELEGQLDLPRLVVDEADAALLAEVITARNLWVRRGEGEAAFEIVDRVVCDWLPARSTRTGRLLAWSERELARLREILDTERDPALRDAAALALAEPLRQDAEQGRGDVIDGFRLDEWGVWEDFGGRMLPIEATIADLPRFVGRSEVLLDELWRTRSFASSNINVYKPVIWFTVPRPLVVCLRVGFHGGRPWTFFPEPSDYFEIVYDASTAAPAGRPRVRVAELADVLPPPVVAPLADDARVAPPWILDESRAEQPTSEIPFETYLMHRRPMGTIWLPDPELAPAAGELRRRYRRAAWIVPNHPPTLSFDGWRHTALGGVGLEWCGLRIGFPSELESALEDAPPGHWWERLRGIDGSDVAMRGARERFLFYDGSVGVHAPITARLDAANPRTLRLEVSRALGQHVSAEPLPRPDFLAPLSIPAVVVVEKRAGEPARGRRLVELRDVPAGYEVDRDALDVHGADLEALVVATLAARGLRRVAAEALVATLRARFFERDGLRALTVLPQELYDEALPLAIAPRPAAIVRVGVIVSEVLP